MNTATITPTSGLSSSTFIVEESACVDGGSYLADVARIKTAHFTADETRELIAALTATLPVEPVPAPTFAVGDRVSGTVTMPSAHRGETYATRITGTLLTDPGNAYGNEASVRWEGNGSQRFVAKDSLRAEPEPLPVVAEILTAETDPVIVEIRDAVVRIAEALTADKKTEEPLKVGDLVEVPEGAHFYYGSDSFAGRGIIDGEVDDEGDVPIKSVGAARRGWVRATDLRRV